MQKYLTVFVIAWQNEFIYRLNFILWRLRNVLRFLMTYFLWTGVFLGNAQVFGYEKSQMLTYVFAVLVVSTLILASPSQDNIGGEISNGDLSNYLVKPVHYIKFWFTRDLSNKLLNLLFSFFEIWILWILLKPQLQISFDPIVWIGSVVSCILAIFLFFSLNILSKTIAFWIPEYTWGLTFVMLVFVETLSGAFFPIDVLPKLGQIAVQLTPFPYLIYYPVAIFIGKIQGFEILRVLIQSTIWFLIMACLTKYFWNKGLKVYGSEGR